MISSTRRQHSARILVAARVPAATVAAAVLGLTLLGHVDEFLGHFADCFAAVAGPNETRHGRRVADELEVRAKLGLGHAGQVTCRLDASGRCLVVDSVADLRRRKHLSTEELPQLVATGPGANPCGLALVLLAVGVG